MNFNQLSVLIISPEPWGKSMVSKHHYALAFANAGHQVYFLTLHASGGIRTDEACDNHPNISLIYFNLSKTINKLRFHWRWAYNQILKLKLSRFIEDYPKFNHVISFDCNGLFTDLNNFKGMHTVFFPVDQVNSRFRKEYKGFDELISISPVILGAFPDAMNKRLFHHGLSPYFMKNQLDFKRVERPNKIAYVGNLLIGPILDKVALKKIIANHQDLEFHFYGAYEPKNSNLGADLSVETLEFVAYLKKQHNCVIHGIVSSEALAAAYNDIDAFLVIYDYKYDKNECSNSHKIMEYLSTGKPIISTRISMYDGLNLFPMLDTFDNTLFPGFFRHQLSNWKSISNYEFHKARILFANQNVYNKKIYQIISDNSETSFLYNEKVQTYE